MTHHYHGKTLKTQWLFRLRRKAQRLTAQARAIHWRHGDVLDEAVIWSAVLVMAYVAWRSGV